MSTPTRSNNRSNGQRTPEPPKVPEVYTFTLPESNEWEVGNWSVLDVDGIPDDVFVVAIRPQDMHVTKTKKSVLVANMSFEKLDRTRTLSLTMIRKLQNGDLNNPDLTNPSEKN